MIEQEKPESIYPLVFIVNETIWCRLGCSSPGVRESLILFG